MANQNINIPYLPVINQLYRRQLLAYIGSPIYLQNDVKRTQVTGFIPDITFPIPVGSNIHTVIFDSYVTQASPTNPCILPAGIQLSDGSLLTNGGSTGDYRQISNDFFSASPTVNNGLYFSQPPVTASGDILDFAIWTDQPGTLQIFDANSTAPLPINNQVSFSFPAGSTSSFMTTVINYQLPIESFFIQINNTGTTSMGANYFYFYLWSRPSYRTP